MSDGVRTSLGAYLLGALHPAERAAVEAHVTGCPSCRDELAALAGLPGLLARLDPAELAPGPEPAADPALADPGLLERTLTELGRRRRRARRLMTAAAASAVLVAGAAGLVLTQQSSPASVVSATDPVTGAAASISLRAVPWGTSVGVRLRHVPVGTRCRLVSVDRQGQRQTIGAWRADYEGSAVVAVASDLPRAQIASLEVVTQQGHRLLSVAVS